MERINRIISHPDYQEAILKNQEAETDRLFCKHGIDHFLDVARIAYIMALEEHSPFSKNTIYATALLHDIGRFMEYGGVMPHDKASAKIAEKILKECGYDEEERTLIENAILNHRKKTSKPTSLDALIHRADKISRDCFACGQRTNCKWSDDKKNLYILI